MSRGTVVVIGLVALLLLTALTVAVSRKAIERDLIQRTTQQLGSNAIVGLTIAAEGRDLRISGELPAGVPPDRVVAVAASVWGVRTVDVAALVRPVALTDPREPLNPRFDTRQIVRIGGDLSNPLDAGTCQRTMARLASVGQVVFASGSASPLLASYPTLNDLATVAYQCPDTYVIIGGHTDGTGDREASLRLSQARAEAVERFFYLAGIAPERLRIVAYGDTQPVASNATREGRAANRRITFEVRPID